MPVDGFPACRFYVELGGSAQAVFTEIGGLQLETEVTDYQEGGNNEYVHRLPGRTKPGTLTLKRGIARSDEFLKWLLEVARGEITRRNVTVVMYDVEGNVLRRWTLEDAFPMKWAGPSFAASSTTVAVETLELAHGGLKLG